MADSTTQTVVDDKTNAQPNKAGAAGTDARKPDDLDALLAEFSAGTSRTASPASKPEKQADEPKGDAALAKRLETLEQRDADRQFKADIKPAIDRVRAAAKVDNVIYDDDDVRDWIDREARKDQRLADAWLNRHNDPEKFGKVLDGLGRKLADRFSKAPDKAATEDRAAVTAAVRGASNKPPEGKAPDYGKMTDAEFAKAVEGQHGFRPI